MISKPTEEEAIFKAACKIKSARDRADYLRDMCEGNDSLHQRMISLLRIFDEDENFLEPNWSVEHQAFDFPSVEPAGTLINRYKLLEPIGEGGMGTVYLAEQNDPVHRQVALKLIKPGMDTRQITARFEAEERALAMMDHPNIAKVFDAGVSDSGRPYFVMELVKGVPIHKFCDENRLDIEQRLKLFIRVCHAIQHAHQKGIIHRDLKPSNVLVAIYDGEAVPKVIDFGVAKATEKQLTEKTAVTATDQIVGTLEYMSPEQTQFNQSDIDTRSDVYSLGAILYELLTGTPPFDRERMKDKAFDETLRMIRQVEPTKPSTKLNSITHAVEVARSRRTQPQKLSTLVRGDLDWIVMKALEKDRQRRYQTANELALDVERYINDEPVSAGPPSATYRFRKFARRNSGKLIAASLIAIVLVLGTVVSAWQAIEASQAKTRATDQAVRARKAEIEAKEKAAITAAVNRFINDDLLGAANAFDEPNRDLTVREVLDRAAEKLESRFPDQPLVKADIHQTLFNAYFSLGLREQATEQLRRLWEIFQTEHGPTDVQTLGVEGRLLENRLLLQNPDAEFLQEVDRYADSCRQALGDAHRVSLNARVLQANALEVSGDYPAAEQRLREATAIFIDTYGDNDPDSLRVMNLLAICLGRQEKQREAEEVFRRFFEIKEARLGPEHPETLSAMHNLAVTIMFLGRNKEAESIFREIVAIRTRVQGEKHPDLLNAIAMLASTLYEQGKYGEAETLFLKNYLLRKDIQGANHRDTMRGMNHLANAMRQQGKLAEADELRREAIRISRAELGENHPVTLWMMSDHAEDLNWMGRFKAAEQLCQVIDQAKTETLGEDSAMYLPIMQTLGDSCWFQGRFEESRGIYQDLIQKLLNETDDSNPSVLRAQSKLAIALNSMGDHAAAESLLQDVLKQQNRIIGSDHPHTLETQLGLADVLRANGRIPEAEQLCRKTLASFEQLLGNHHPLTTKAKCQLARDLILLNRYSEAEEFTSQSLESNKVTLGIDHPQTIDNQKLLAEIRGHSGQHVKDE